MTPLDEDAIREAVFSVGVIAFMAIAAHFEGVWAALGVFGAYCIWRGL